MQTPQSSRPTASSVFASKLGSYRPTASSFIASRLGSYRLNANLLEPGLPANEALWCFSYNASSFFAGKPRSNRDHQPSGSGAWSGLHSDDAGAAVSRPTAPSVFAGKLGFYRPSANLLEPGLPANEALWCFSYNASSFFAGKPRSNRDHQPSGSGAWSGLYSDDAGAAVSRPTASSFIASKPGSNGNKHFLWKILWAVVWCPRIRHRHS